MACLGHIAFQDLKDRRVYWFLFLTAMILFGLTHYMYSGQQVVFLNYIYLNILIVSLIVLILFAYTRIITKQKFLNHSLGLGDILFFYAFALGFPTLTFIVLFANAILFSLFSFVLLKGKFQNTTVPLAGLMSLFLILVFGYSLIFKSPSLYAY